MANRIKDLSGMVSGSLTAVAPCCKLDSKRKGEIFWVCNCNCGTKNHLVSKGNLTSGKTTKSCGCLKGYVKHGHKRRNHSGMSSTYQSWRAMKERCLDPNSQGYQNYGERGVTICDRWLNEDGFKNFLADMGERPEGMTLDRVDVDAGYCPENCRWATRTEQARNTRKNRIWIFNGKSYCETELCNEHNINLRTFRHRIALGWELEQAVTIPVGKRRVKKSAIDRRLQGAAYLSAPDTLPKLPYNKNQTRSE